MKVLIVGAGSVGSVLARLLGKKKSIAVTCATNDLKGARPFMAIAGKRARLAKADASDARSIVRVAKGADLIVNASSPRFNLRAMRAALAVRANYMDLDSLLKDCEHAEQLIYDRMFRRAGLTGLMNAGVSPGLTNVLAAEAAAKYGSLRSLKFRVLEEQDADELIPTWSPQVLKDELTAPPLVFRGGTFGHTRPFKDAQTFDFPEPYGRRRVVSIFGDEVATIPLFIKVRDVDYKAGGQDVELALAGEKGERREVPTPEEMRRLVADGTVRDARLIVSVEARGGGRGPLTLHTVFPDIRSIMRRAPGATYIGYPTALCAAAFIGAFPLIKEKGVFPPEALPQRARRAVLAELTEAGVIIRTSKDRP